MQTATLTYNDGAYLPDLEHPFYVGECPDCHWDVYGPQIDTPAIHFACDMNRQLNAA